MNHTSRVKQVRDAKQNKEKQRKRTGKTRQSRDKERKKQGNNSEEGGKAGKAEEQGKQGSREGGKEGGGKLPERCKGWGDFLLETARVFRGLFPRPHAQGVAATCPLRGTSSATSALQPDRDFEVQRGLPAQWRQQQWQILAVLGRAGRARSASAWRRARHPDRDNSPLAHPLLPPSARAALDWDGTCSSAHRRGHKEKVPPTATRPQATSPFNDRWRASPATSTAATRTPYATQPFAQSTQTPQKTIPTRSTSGERRTASSPTMACCGFGASGHTPSTRKLIVSRSDNSRGLAFHGNRRFRFQPGSSRSCLERGTAIA